MRVMVIPIVRGALGIISRSLLKRLEDLKKNRGQVDSSIPKIGQNTEFRRLEWESLSLKLL